MFPDVEEMATVVVGAIKEALDPIDDRLAALEGLAPRDGRDGKDAPAPDLDLIAVKAAALVPVIDVAKQAAALIEVPKDGRDGADVDVDVVVAKVLSGVSEQIAALVAREVTKAVASIEKPKDGAPGRDGVDGKDGQDGETVTLAQVSSVILAEVTKAVDAIPRPKDGAPGRDGTGVAGALLDNAGTLVLTLSNGTLQPLGVVVGAKGEPGHNGSDGKDGADGVGFDDLSVEHDGEQTVSLTFTKGERVKSFPVVFPVPVYKGIFDVTKTYERGYQVTWAGSAWQAIRQTSGLKPGEGPVEKTGWLLVTKKGRDGKNGKDGEPGHNGRDGKDGVSKW